MSRSQAEVRAWFDATYEEKGLRYLRPLEAYPIFLQLLEAEAGQRLLDVACGPGQLLRAAVGRGVHAFGVDLSRAALRMAREYVPAARVVEANAEALPFADASFDLVTCIGSIERFFDRDRALGEIRRVVRDDGRVCVMVRNASTLVWRVWRQCLGRRNARGHQDALDLDAWRRLWKSSGFEVEALYMDQWLRQRLRKVMRGFRPAPAGRPEPVARPFLPMSRVNEFIFLLRKELPERR